MALGTYAFQTGSEAFLLRANFTGAKLEGADFTSFQLSDANFPRADLRRADFFEAQLEAADFSGSNLKGATMPKGWKPTEDQMPDVMPEGHTPNTRQTAPQASKPRPPTL